MEAQEKICHNCQSSLSTEDVYCAHCGQKYRKGKPTLWMVIGDFFSSLFNLDSTVYRSMFALFVPGRLTKAFIDRRLKSYAPPIRIFIVSSLLLVTALTLSYDADTIKDNLLAKQDNHRWHRSAVLMEIEDKKAEIYQAYVDSSAFAVIDTLLQQMRDSSFTDSIQLIAYHDWNLEPDKKASWQDIFTLSEDSLFRKYEIESFTNQLIARQQIKVFKDNSKVLRYLISRISLMTLFMMPVLALLLKLLYWRRKQYYYIDHFTFGLHYHSFAFVLIGLFTLWDSYYEPPDEALSWASKILVLLIAGYIFIAMKQVYGQGVGKTIVKYLILNTSYLFILLVFFLLTLAVSFLLF